MEQPNISLTADQLQGLVQAAVAGALAQVATPVATPSPRRTAIDRPVLDLGASDGAWAFFNDEWAQFKLRCQLGPSEVSTELRACCSLALRQELFSFYGPDLLSSASERELLGFIKAIAVQGRNTAVHRQEFYSLRQDDGQSGSAFVTQLKGKAAQCSFAVPCPHCSRPVSYQDSMVADQMIVGARDSDIQCELMARDSSLTTFSEKYQLFQSLEKGKVATSQLLDGTAPSATVGSQKSAPSRPARLRRPAGDNRSSGCPGCGSSDHGRGTERPRASHCPARGKTCTHCGIANHFARVCRQKQSPSSSAPTPTASSSVSYFAAIHGNGHPHMEWTGERFEPCVPSAHPTVSAQFRVMHDAHATFGKRLDPGLATRPAAVDTFADTGAMACASGPELLDALGIPERYLIRTSHRIHGVTGSSLNVIGSLLVVISVDGRETRQVMYIARNLTGTYLSARALADLGITQRDFPRTQRHACMSSTPDQDPVCSCPPRSPPPPLPDSLPLPATAANRASLERWILDRYSSSAFNTCEHQPLPKMSGQPLDIHFRSECKPTAHHCPIPVPHHWKSQVKQDLDRDVRLGIIEPVPQGTPTVWCARMVVVGKKDGSPRRTVDLQPLNDATYRETHHTPSPFNQASVVPPNTKKTVLDAWNGYHSLALAPNARDATTFITEWGRYRYLSAPQGFHAAGDAYTRRFDDITVDVPRKSKCVDDTLLWDEDIESAFWHTLQYLDLCSKSGIIFNREKFRFACDDLEFAGFQLSPTGLRPANHVLDAIRSFPTPTDITGARSWFGLVNQVAYAFSMTDEMQPFRDLLKPSNPWYWDEELDRLFHKSREVIVQQVEHGVRTFEVGRPTCLATDWSKTGIGFFLLQKFCSCKTDLGPNCCPDGWHLVFAGSRFTTPAESRYAPVEGEALAVVDALQKCRMFVLGCPDLLVAVDHKPLVKILGDRSLADIDNPRLLRLKEKSLRYQFRIKHVPGIWHKGPDACSRYPSPAADPTPADSSLRCLRVSPSDEDMDASLSLERHIEAAAITSLSGHGTTQGVDIRALTWDRLKHASARDPDIVDLVAVISNGFPSVKPDLSANLQPFWDVRASLSHSDGVVLYRDRIVVPQNLRGEVLDCLHSAHQGVAGMKARARVSVYWPGMSQAIASRRAQCRTCNEIAPSQPREPLIPSPAPEYPFQCVAADYFSLAGTQYLVYVDRYTGWFTIVHCNPREADASCLIKELRQLFATYGVPEELATDGGSTFVSHRCQAFLSTWGVSHRLSSAHHSQSNGRAELGVKTAKRLLRDHTGPGGNLHTDAFVRALLQWRNTPSPDLGLSPAQLLYGRRLRDLLPSLSAAHRLRPEWQLLAHDREVALAKRHLRNVERFNEHATSLPELPIGQTVAVQNQHGPRPNRWDKTGVILDRDDRQYVVRMDGSRRCSLRNRRFLRPITPCLSTASPVRVPVSIGPSPPPTASSPQQLDQPSEATTEPFATASLTDDSSPASAPISPPPLSPTPRCSARPRRAPRRLSPCSGPRYRYV